MYGLFGSVKNSTTIDNDVFRIHYKMTVIVLVAFSLVVAYKQYIGDPIDCLVDGVPSHVMDIYCLTYSSFTTPNKQMGKVGQDIVQPESHEQYHKYYQWVCFVLIFQSILFYMPHYLWKYWENGRIKSLLLNLNDAIIDDETKNGRINAITEYFAHNSKSLDLYFSKYFVCELLTFVNVLGQVFGEFLTYGLDLVAQYNSESSDGNKSYIAKVFPKITRCSFSKYSATGDLRRYEGSLCVLPVNILNEKIYAIIWFWFIILIIMTAIVIVYRIIIIFFSCTRVLALCFGNIYINRRDVQFVVTRSSLDDWFVLNQLRKNIDQKTFAEIIEELSKSL